MLMLISPAKTLDYTGADYARFTLPAVLDRSEVLAKQLSGYDAAELSVLMKISDKLADLNYQRYQEFQVPFTLDNAKQALLAFKGDVYKGMTVDSYTDEDLAFAQDHLRILSGLYGVLRPLDLMQPYRLEMGTKLSNEKGKNLYEFWGTQISELLNAGLQSHDDPCIVNLASNEYFKSVDRETLKARVLNIDFKENKDGDYKIVAIYAKRARGLMADFVIRNRIERVEALQGFDAEGYTFRESLSAADHWIFCRD
ncbi:MAG: peroxide stress protein YaaA [Phormidesmis sp.]